MRNLKKQVDKYEYVFFDMFDTLIKRTVRYPVDVFELMQHYCMINNIEGIENFKEKRIKAGNLAYELSNGEDADYDKIYDQLRNEYCNDTLQYLKKLEIDTELEVCVPNLDMVDLYDYCVKSDKKIIIVSDMYFSKDELANILHKNGFTTYNKIYVSSKESLTKRSGNLFRYIIDELKINKRHFIHIGDNKIGDFIRPRMMGIKAVLIKKYVNYLKYYNEVDIAKDDLFAYRSISSYINNTMNRNKSPYWQIGYEAFGVLLYGFSDWLLDNLKEKGIKNVYFLSRDGYIMKRCFDVINDDDIKTHYLYGSRRSLIIPMIWAHIQLRDILEYISLDMYVSIEMILLRMGLEPSVYVGLLNEFGLKLDTIMIKNEIENHTGFCSFYEMIKNDVFTNSKAEYKLLVEYIKQNELNGEIAIVDIGWVGRMQGAICELIKLENLSITVHGYYSGVTTKTKRPDRIMSGYLHQYGNNKELFIKRECYMSIYETFFLAQHGSVKKFAKSQDGIVPVLYPYEYTDADGKFTKEARIVSQIQEGAFDFVKSFNKNQIFSKLKISPYTAIQNMQQLGVRPTLSDAKLFGDFKFYDLVVMYISKPDRLIKYIFNPKKLFIDFRKAPWRIGFFYRLFKLPLPYYKIYMKINKVFGEKD